MLYTLPAATVVASTLMTDCAMHMKANQGLGCQHVAVAVLLHPQQPRLSSLFQAYLRPIDRLGRNITLLGS